MMGDMHREAATIGHKKISYLISETPAPGSRAQPLGTVVFLHAFPLNASMWQSQATMVPPGWRMIAPDYRGFGESSLSSSEKPTMNDLGGDVVDLLDHLEVADAVVAGCSMGGYVAFEVLESAPNYVSGLVLIDTRAGADTDEGKANRLKMLARLEEGGAGLIAGEMTPKLLGATTQHERPDLVTRLHGLIGSTSPAAIKMAINAMMNRKDMTGLLPTIKIPTLIIAGAEDTLIPLSASEEMHKAMKLSQLEVIPHAGHLPSLEQTTAFNAALARFLQRF
jgi:pimeloyl-ACP methyl ester carboxylesterase